MKRVIKSLAVLHFYWNTVCIIIFALCLCYADDSGKFYSPVSETFKEANGSVMNQNYPKFFCHPVFVTPP